MGKGTYEVKVGLAEMLKGGVIMDVTNPEQAKIAEDSGAVAVMALERIPSDIRKDGGIARMSDPYMIMEIKNTVSIPVMAKCRIGHFAEAQILEALEVDFIDESEVLTPADDNNHIYKHGFNVPIDHWLRGEWSDLVEETFDKSSNLSKLGMLSKNSMRKAKEMLNDRERLNGHSIFSFIMLNKWLSS